MRSRSSRKRRIYPGHVHVILPPGKARLHIEREYLHRVVLDICSIVHDQRRILDDEHRVEDPFHLQLIDVILGDGGLRTVPAHDYIVVHHRPVIFGRL